MDDITLKNILDKCFEDFRLFCDNRHDEVVNQKYDKILPYSVHTDIVLSQGEKFLYLITDLVDKFITRCGLKGHDLIEDTRLTFNDIKEVLDKILVKNGLYSDNMTLDEIAENDYIDIPKQIAEVIYLCTDYKGRTRGERKPIEYYKELIENKIAVFVKISDIIGNTKYSFLKNTPMFAMYKKEWQSKVRNLLHTGSQKCLFNYPDGSVFQPMFDYLDKIYDL